MPRGVLNQDQQEEDESVSLDSITVTATAADASDREGLPVAYTGGQVATGSRMGMWGNRDILDVPFSATSYTSKLMEDQQRGPSQMC